jgi:putative addiction module component (TIGR02574 family)
MAYTKQISAVFSLPAKQRAKLASDLIHSLHEGEPSDADAGPVWANEIERRIEEMRGGDVKMLTLGEFKKKLRAPRKRK